MMYRLFYVSRAARDMDEESVDSLAEQAASNNASSNIVGALCYNGVAFGQVLEGPQEDIFRLLDSIRADSRHEGVIVVAEKPIRFRHFKDFHMKRVRGMDFNELIEAMAAD